MSSPIQPMPGELPAQPAILPMVTGLRIPATGVPEVDAAAAHLAKLADADVHDHPALYDEVHRGLSAALDVAMGETTQ